MNIIKKVNEYFVIKSEGCVITYITQFEFIRCNDFSQCESMDEKKSSQVISSRPNAKNVVCYEVYAVVRSYNDFSWLLPGRKVGGWWTTSRTSVATLGVLTQVSNSNVNLKQHFDHPAQLYRTPINIFTRSE